MSDILKIINYFGIENQLGKLREECNELIEAIENYEDGSDTLDHIIEELADVRLILDQFKLKYEITNGQINTNCEFKIHRTLNRYNIE